MFTSTSILAPFLPSTVTFDLPFESTKLNLTSPSTTGGCTTVVPLERGVVVAVVVVTGFVVVVVVSSGSPLTTIVSSSSLRLPAFLVYLSPPLSTIGDGLSFTPVASVL